VEIWDRPGNTGFGLENITKGTLAHVIGLSFYWFESFFPAVSCARLEVFLKMVSLKVATQVRVTRFFRIRVVRDECLPFRILSIFTVVR
jgi:hypothetical protein